MKRIASPPIHRQDDLTFARRRTCAVLLIVTMASGLVWRLAPLHLPAFAFKYGGSALWAMAVYWVVAILLPRKPIALLALIAGVIAVGVECFKQVRSPSLDHFRETLAGKLLLGRYFTWGAMVAYLMAIVAIAWVDARLRSGTRPAASAPIT